MIRLQNYVIGALVKYYAVERTALGAAFIEEPADMQYAAQVAAWYASLAPEQRLPIEALRVLAAPDLLADIRVLRGRDSLTRTCYLAKLRATGPEGLLVAPQQDGSLDIQRVASDDAVTDTMLAWLAAGGEPGEPLWRVSLTRRELAVLLAWLDLDAQAAWSAMLSHQPRAESFSAEQILAAAQRANSVPDPRWIAPFLMPLLGEDAVAGDLPTVTTALHGLQQKGLAASEGSAWKWSLAGAYVSESFQRRAVTMALDTLAAAPDGRIGRHAACLIRCDEPLWLLDLPFEGEATLAGVSLLEARQVLEALLTPAGRAPALAAQDLAAQQAPGIAPAPQPPYPPPQAVPLTPTAWPAAQQAQFRICPGCRQSLPPHARFCGFCGTKLG